jgi:cystathionine gamma-synthase
LSDSNEQERGAAEASLDTLVVHGGEPRPKAYGCITTPVAHSATFTFADTAQLRDYFEGREERLEYGRYGNPTVEVAEAKIAALDGTEAGCLFSSGMAALTTTLLAMLRSGQHVIMADDCYRRTRQFVTTVLGRFGVEHTVVPAGDYGALEGAIRPGATRLILAESPTNPYLMVTDLGRVAELARKYRVKTLIDSTFATPINQRPADWGIDLVVHSATKYLAGHNDLLAGSLSGKSGLVEAVREVRGVLGPVLDPTAAYLLVRGLKTLHLRVARQNETALRLARFLEAHPRIARVHYPGLESHRDHVIAREQMTGFGGVISFEVASDLDGTSRFIDACRIPQIAPSLGGVESLIEQPALMSFYELTEAQRLAVGIRGNLVRMAVGLESADDLEADLGRALEAVP